MKDATDATFDHDVLARSVEVPVVVDLWAPWCGPCRTLSPIIERVAAALNGALELVKVNVDENPAISQAFRVQSIPTVVAIKDRQVVDAFMGALPEPQVAEWMGKLVASPEQIEVDELVAKGDEQSLRLALEIDPNSEKALVALGGILVERGDVDEATALLAKLPETPEVRRLRAVARLAGEGVNTSDQDITARLENLLERVKTDEAARREYVDILDAMEPDDPRTSRYRKALSDRLF